MTTALAACADPIATRRTGHDGSRTPACCETAGDVDAGRGPIHGQEMTA
jgi:hypothetical protein